MTPDAHTPCPCCPEPVRELVVTSERLLDALREALRRVPTAERDTPEFVLVVAAGVELRRALRDVRPFYDAHQANQVHNTSPELAEERCPVLVLPDAEPVLPWR